MNPTPIVVTDTDEAVAHFTHALSASDSLRFVAIAGPTAVGKSTLSRRFLAAAQEANVVAFVLEGDRFLIPQARRKHPAAFPDDVYELDRLHSAVLALSTGQRFLAPFYERDGRHTGRLIAGGGNTNEVMSLCRSRACSPENHLQVSDSGEVCEVIDPARGLWILDSELSLLYPETRDLYDLSYGIRASREVRKAHFLGAVRKGERYPYLEPEEARAKIEGFWETDDALIEPTVAFADVQIELH